MTRRGEEDGFHLEIESSEPSDEKTELLAVDPLCSRGIGGFSLQDLQDLDFFF